MSLSHTVVRVEDIISSLTEVMQWFVALEIQLNNPTQQTAARRAKTHPTNFCTSHITSVCTRPHPQSSLKDEWETPNKAPLIIPSVFALFSQRDCISVSYQWIFICLFPIDQSTIYFPRPLFNAQTHRPWPNCLLIFSWINNISEFLSRRQPSPKSSHYNGNFLTLF